MIEKINIKYISNNLKTKKLNSISSYLNRLLTTLYIIAIKQGEKNVC